MKVAYIIIAILQLSFAIETKIYNELNNKSWIMRRLQDNNDDQQQQDEQEQSTQIEQPQNLQQTLTNSSTNNLTVINSNQGNYNASNSSQILNDTFIPYVPPVDPFLNITQLNPSAFYNITYPPYNISAGYQAGDLGNKGQIMIQFQNSTTPGQYTTWFTFQNLQKFQIESIYNFDNFFYYAMTNSGLENKTSPICKIDADCGPTGYKTHCCANVIIKSPNSSTQTNIFRCMDRGLVDGNYNFQFSTFNTQISCQKSKNNKGRFLISQIIIVSTVFTLLNI